MLFMHSIKGVESSVAGLQAPNQQKNTPPNKNSKSAPKKGKVSFCTAVFKANVDQPAT